MRGTLLAPLVVQRCLQPGFPSLGHRRPGSPLALVQREACHWPVGELGQPHLEGEKWPVMFRHRLEHVPELAQGEACVCHLVTRMVVVCGKTPPDPRTLGCCPFVSVRCPLRVSYMALSVLGASGRPAGGDPAPLGCWVGLGSRMATFLPQPGGLGLSEGGKFNFYKINGIGVIFLAECGSNNRPLIEKGN